MKKRVDTRTGVIFVALKDSGSSTLMEAYTKGWRDTPFAELARHENVVWVYDADHMVRVKDRHALLTGSISSISEVKTHRPNYYCINCGEQFYSAGGRIREGTCGQPGRNAACPLDVIQ